MNEVKNDLETFEAFVKLYPDLLEIGKKINKNPGALLNVFVSIGKEALSRSSDELFNEFANKLKSSFENKTFTISNKTVDSFENLLNFLKENNRRKK